MTDQIGQQCLLHISLRERCLWLQGVIQRHAFLL